MKQYVVDAFADRVFEGNPAAVCVMDRWLPDGTMRNIAVENNLSESAFVVPESGGTIFAGSRRAGRSTCAAMRRWPRPLSS